MDYLKLRRYETVKDKFKLAKRMNQLRIQRGIHEVLPSEMRDIEGNLLSETVYFHDWNTEYSCYVTERYRLFYKD
jgi:hypothetical protein